MDEVHPAAGQRPACRGAVEPGTEPGLEATDYFGPRYGATASGVHAMIVELDPETMALSILRYVIVHDCGNVINPLILDGQIPVSYTHLTLPTSDLV